MVKRVTQKAAERGYLDGQFLIAMPGMQDTRFSRTVVYICAHSADGAMGIMVNQPAPHITFPDLLVKLDVIPATDLIALPSRAGGVKVLDLGVARDIEATSITMSGRRKKISAQVWRSKNFGIEWIFTWGLILRKRSSRTFVFSSPIAFCIA